MLAEDTAPNEIARPALLKDRAYDELKRLILTGVFPPGAFLSERQLAARLRMSKTPIRAALERLAGEGFVAVPPQQGIVVREQPVREVVDLFDLRAALEVHIMRGIAGRLDAAQAAQLRQNLRRQDAAAAAADVERAATLDTEFHLLLGECLGNAEIVRALRQALDRLYRTIVTSLHRDVARLAASHQEHERIAADLLAGDADAAAAQLATHLDWAKQFLIGR